MSGNAVTPKAIARMILDITRFRGKRAVTWSDSVIPATPCLRKARELLFQRFREATLLSSVSRSAFDGQRKGKLSVKKTGHTVSKVYSGRCGSTRDGTMGTERAGAGDEPSAAAYLRLQIGLL
jgi:hypothetical protein